MKKLYLYIRLSDADDDLKFKTESESIANQRTLLYRFIRARREFDGYEVVEFVDDGYSGTNGNRPSFERMIESLKNGEASLLDGQQCAGDSEAPGVYRCDGHESATLEGTGQSTDDTDG